MPSICKPGTSSTGFDPHHCKNKNKQIQTIKKEIRANLTPTISNFVNYKIIPGKHNRLQLAHQYHDLLQTDHNSSERWPPNSLSCCCQVLTLGTSPLLWASQYCWRAATIKWLGKRKVEKGLHASPCPFKSNSTSNTTPFL